MEIKVISFISLVIAVTNMSACATDKDPTAIGGYAKTEKIKITNGAIFDKPRNIDPELVKIGEQLYQQSCVFCHQADAIGKPGVAPSLTNQEFLSIASDEFLMQTIIEGRANTGMAPFGHLQENQILAIVAYLRNHAKLPSRAKEINSQAIAHGDPRLGKTWYEQICATCHGPNGNGYSAGGTGTAIGTIGFLSKATDGFIRTTIKEGRSNTRMRGFQGADGLANLSDQEIDDIIVYLRSISQSRKQES